MEPSIIKAEHLQKIHHNGQTKTEVIKSIDLQLNRGEFTIIMGNSGSGKSSLLYLLSGLDTATDGKIWIDNLPIHGKTESQLALMRRKNIGYVFQDHNLVPSITLRENVLVAGFLSGRKRKVVANQADSLLEVLGISSVANRLPSQVSGGERQRGAIARAMINDPLVLMADEPTGSLNSAAAEKVLDIMTSLNRKGQSIIMVTHDLKSACRGDRVYFLRDGSVVDTFVFGDLPHGQERETALFAWLKQLGW
jgi:putative ABC transport system ATP-binding protein